METGEVKKYYTWNVGPDKGSIESYLCEDDARIWFESGASVQKDLLLVSLYESNESEYISFQNSQPQIHQQSLPQITDWESKLGNPVANNQPQIAEKAVERSPIQIILEKQKKFNSESVDISILFEFPIEKAIEFMTMMFDEDEVIEEVTNFVYTQMASTEINDAIKNTIRDKIKSSLEAKSE